MQRRESRAFGIPLVPAHQSTDPADGGVEGAVAEVARSEVILFVVQGIVGDVHLAIEPEQGAVSVENDRGVVIDAGSALLKERGDEDNAKLFGQRCQTGCDRPGNGLGEIEQGGVLALAEILGLKKLGQADDLRSPRGRLMDFVDGALKILVGIGRGRHLYESDFEFLRRQSGALLKEK